jgi:hypothetical protein
MISSMRNVKKLAMCQIVTMITKIKHVQLALLGCFIIRNVTFLACYQNTTMTTEAVTVLQIAPKRC